jgi:hypothetical protein
MLIDHDHPPGLFDAGHCWACAHQAGLLDHYDRVQDQEANLRQAREWPGRPTGTPSGPWDPPPSGFCWPRPPSSRDEQATRGVL